MRFNAASRRRAVSSSEYCSFSLSDMRAAYGKTAENATASETADRTTCAADDLDPTIGLVKEKLIGRAIVLWTRVEAALEDMIWHFFGAQMEKGRIITTRMDATAKLKMLRDLANLELKDPQFSGLLTVLDRIDILRDDRNAIVHGIWGRDPHGTPMVVSLRPKPLAPDQATSETFSDTRMRELIRKIDAARMDILRMMLEIFGSPETPAAPSPEGQPPRPQNPDGGEQEPQPPLPMPKG